MINVPHTQKKCFSESSIIFKYTEEGFLNQEGWETKPAYKKHYSLFREVETKVQAICLESFSKLLTESRRNLHLFVSKAQAFKVQVRAIPLSVLIK